MRVITSAITPSLSGQIRKQKKLGIFEYACRELAIAHQQSSTRQWG
jgi:hypothetical protein